MEQRKFEVGDKVKYVNDSGYEYFGEVLKADHQSDLIVGLKNFNGHSCAVTNPDLINYIQQKGYVGRCVHLESIQLELVEEKEMTGFEVLLKHWGIEVGEKFNIKEGMCNPYHFDEHTRLIDCDGDVAGLSEWRLVKGELTIQKIEVKEMTMKEICEALGYEVKIKKEDK